MESIPPNLLDSLPVALVSDAETWWLGLTAEERSELTRLCDARKDVFLFETFSDGKDGPSVTGGKFIPHDNAFGIDDWGEDYFQHLLDHPELMIVFEPQQRTFHIGCSRHIDARRCFADGAVSQSFACPFGSDRCLMHAIIGNRSSVNLRPVRRGV